MIRAVRPGSIQSTSVVRKVCLVGPTAGRAGVRLHNGRLLGARLYAKAFHILDLLGPDPSNASIS